MRMSSRYTMTKTSSHSAKRDVIAVWNVGRSIGESKWHNKEFICAIA